MRIRKMEYDDVIKETGKHAWWSEECPCVLQYLYLLKCFMTQSSVFHPKLLTIAIVIFKGDYFYERTPEDEKYAVYRYVFGRMKKDRKYLDRCIKDNRRKKKECFSLISGIIRNRERMSNRQLWDSYSRFMRKYLAYMSYGAGIECIDILTSYYLEGMVRKEIPDVPALREIISVLTSPKKLSFMEKERESFLGICLSGYDDIRKNRMTERLKKQLDRHSREYSYVLSNFKDARFLDSKYFLEESREEVKKGKEKLSEELDSLKNKIALMKEKEKEIMSRYRLSEDLKLHLKITRIMGESIDERKETMLKNVNYLEVCCREIAKRFSMDARSIKSYTFDEVKELLLHNKRVDEDLAGKRRKIAAYVITRKSRQEAKIDCFYGKQAEAILRKTSPEIRSGKVKGQVASAPVKKITGKVQVVLDVSRAEFEKGNILVATMTRPEFVPLMRKASAIITDEGGITCHAAIVSRELKIPCIIGTKTATRILKDGDIVEVDADKGIVRKIG